MKIEPKVAKRLMGTNDGKKLLECIVQIITELDSVTGISQTDPHEIALEVKARALAVDKLKDIFLELTSGIQQTSPVEQTDEFKM
jgi:hypothetical protein